MNLLCKGIWSENDCYIWPAPIDKDGYGRTTVIENKVRISWRVSRLLWTLTNGEIPKGMLVCHTCDNPRCFNLDHLFLGTPSENSQDRNRKGRARVQIGEKNHRSILTKDKVIDIRRSYENGMKECDIVRKFELNQGTVSKILLRKRWKHI